MKKALTLLMIVLFLGCGDGTEKECNTTITCEDDKELLCEQPTFHENKNGDTVEVRACTYITYEHCFEETVCTSND